MPTKQKPKATAAVNSSTSTVPAEAAWNTTMTIKRFHSHCIATLTQCMSYVLLCPESITHISP